MNDLFIEILVFKETLHAMTYFVRFIFTEYVNTQMLATKSGAFTCKIEKLVIN